MSSSSFLTMSTTDITAQIAVSISSDTISDFSALSLVVSTSVGQDIINNPIKSGAGDAWLLNISRELAFPEGATDMTITASIDGVVKSKIINILVSDCNPTDPLSSFATSGEFYMIGSASQLLCLSQNQTSEVLSADYRLGADIDFGSYSTVDWDGNGSPDGSGTGGWVPIGSYTDADNNIPYTGVFDGDNYSISNLYINRGSVNYQALFGYIENSTLKNIDILNANIYGDSVNGSLVARTQDSFIYNSYSSGSVRSSYANAGGLGGGLFNTTVTNCGSSVTVTGAAHYMGGLIGYTRGSDVSYSYATGNVTCTNWYAGGLIGSIGDSVVSKSYATGNVTCNNWYAGGLTAQISMGGSISDCYATGSVTGGGYSAGLVAHIYSINSDSIITNSYSSSSVSVPFGGGLIGRFDSGYNEVANINNSYAINSSYTALYGKAPSSLNYCSESYDVGCHGTDYILGSLKDNWDDAVWENLEDTAPRLEWQDNTEIIDSVYTSVGGPV